MAAGNQHNEENKPVRNVLRVLKIKPHACRVGWGQAKRWGFFGVCFSQLQNVKTHVINGRWVFQIKTTPYPRIRRILVQADSCRDFWGNQLFLTQWGGTDSHLAKMRANPDVSKLAVSPGNTKDHRCSQEHCSSFRQTQNISRAQRRQAQGPAAVTSLLQATKLAKICYKAR